MGEAIIRWTVNVDSQTDIDLRTYLAARGLKKGGLSKFIEESVKWRLLDLSMAEARTGFDDLEEDEFDAMLDEAMTAVRRA